MPIPSEPILLLKPTSSIVGPNDDVEVPPEAGENGLGNRARRRHWQARQVRVVGMGIGPCGRMNDVSERSYQLERGG